MALTAVEEARLRIVERMLERLLAQGVREANLAVRKMRAAVLDALSSGKVPDIATMLVQTMLDKLTDAMLASHLLALRNTWRSIGVAPVDPTSIRDANAVTLSLANDMSRVLQILERQINADTDDLRRQYGSRALTILGEAGGENERVLRAKLNELIGSQLNSRDAIKELRTTFDNLGMSNVKSHQIEAIFRTQTRIAYSAGEWQATRDPVVDEILWGYKYSTVGDDRVRPSHAKLDGVTLPKDHPFWDRFLPPNGWNCRCRAIPLFSPPSGGIKAPPGDAEPDRGFGLNFGRVYGETAQRATVDQDEDLSGDPLTGNPVEGMQDDVITLLRKFPELSNAEIADMAGTSAASVASIKSRAKKAGRLGPINPVKPIVQPVDPVVKPVVKPVKGTKGEQIVAYIKQNPNASNAEVAKLFDTTPANVASVKSRAKKAGLLVPGGDATVTVQPVVPVTLVTPDIKQVREEAKALIEERATKAEDKRNTASAVERIRERVRVNATKYEAEIKRESESARPQIDGALDALRSEYSDTLKMVSSSDPRYVKFRHAVQLTEEMRYHHSGRTAVTRAAKFKAFVEAAQEEVASIRESFLNDRRSRIPPEPPYDGRSFRSSAEVYDKQERDRRDAWTALGEYINPNGKGEKTGPVKVKRTGLLPEVNRAVDTALEFFHTLIPEDGLTHFREREIKVKNDTTGRAHAFVDEHVIHIGARDGAATVVHELAHLLEADPKVKELTHGFLSRRLWRDRRGPTDVKLATKRGEVGFKDDFGIGGVGLDDNPAAKRTAQVYVGRYYGDDTSEAISMGMEQLYRDPRYMAKNDPEFFDFMVALLKGLHK